MEQKTRVIYDSITGMTKEELTRFLAMVAPTIACRMCPYWDVNEERCFADRDFFCTNDYAEALIAKYLDCPVDGEAHKTGAAKRAVWIKAEATEKNGDSYCSACGHFDWSDCKYCSECGSEMSKERRAENG